MRCQVTTLPKHPQHSGDFGEQGYIQERVSRVVRLPANIRQAPLLNTFSGAFANFMALHFFVFKGNE